MEMVGGPGALVAAMLGSKASMYPVGNDDQTCAAPFSQSSVISWPSAAGGSSLPGALPLGDARGVTECDTRLRLSAEEHEVRISSEGRAGLYWGPGLIEANSSYCNFVANPYNRNMCTYSSAAPVHSVGVFVVYTKSGGLRVTVDARRTGQRFPAPEATLLGGAASLAGLRIGDG